MSRRKSTRRPLSRAKRLPKLPDGHVTVREIRQVLGTGTVADVAALLPPQPDTNEIGLDAPEEVMTRIPDRTVEVADRFVAKSGICTFVDTAYDAMKEKSGREIVLTSRAIFVAMRLATRDSRPLLLVEIRDILYRRLSTPMRRLLDIPDDPFPTDPDEARKWRARTVAQVKRAFHRILAPIDPSVMPKNRIMTAERANQLKKDLSLSEQHERAVALDWVTGQVLEAAYQQLPERVRARREQRETYYCIDGTPLQSFARARGLKSGYISTDPDSGRYFRLGDHAEPGDANASAGKSTTGQKAVVLKSMWARELNLITTADASHPTRLYMPTIGIAATTDRPGVDPAGAARRLFADLAGRDHQPGKLAGDILYTNQNEAKFQSPAREAGYDLVLGYGKDQTGLQGTHESGAMMVDGAYMAPCLPDDLIGIMTDRRNGEITQKEAAQKIKARAEYRMRTKQKADPSTGVRERLSCPAAGPSPTAICELKSKSKEPRPTRQPDGAVVDVRRKIKHKKVLTNGVAPKVCQQEAISLAPADGAKFRQSMTYGSDEHTAVYHRLRQSQEGFHGSAKDDAQVALANPGRRRVRGWAAQQLFAAFLIAETSTRRILTFLRNAKTDHNGDLYVDRRPIPGVEYDPTVLTTGSLPGAPPIGEPDDGEAA
ncbi:MULTISPECIES: hypothetical protein [unclassified Nocardioides]|uniref:hypothetical protein n=1 Tax=unclassified Nocardioides TaxID=2615069 RepID=UPI0036210F42